MKQLKMIICMIIFHSALWANPNCSPIEVLSGDYVDLTLNASKLYRIDGCVTVTGELEIPAGTQITFSNNDNLFVEGKINAVGTDSNQIVFTSVNSPGSRVPLTNAGVYILGKAPLNQTTLVMPCNKLHTSGNDPDDNSGHMEHVRVEFLSGSLGFDHMDNGISLIGLGNETLIKNIQVSNSLHTGLAIYGGEVTIKELFLLDNHKNNTRIAYGNTSEISQMLAMNKDPAATDASGTNGLMVWNNDFDSLAVPLTNPTILNSSIIGLKFCDLTDVGNGIEFDFNGGGLFKDLVITGFTNGIYINDEESANRTATGDLKVEYTSFTDNVYDYNFGAFTWLGNGCGDEIEFWIDGSAPLCGQQSNQFGVAPLGYDVSFCEDFCSPTFVKNFVLNPSITRLDEPSSTSVLDFRGSIGDSKRFEWVEPCPQNYEACIPAPLLKVGQLDIHPNPAIYTTTIDFESKLAQTVEVQVMEMVTGRIMYQTKIKVEEGKQSVNIPTQALKEGLYNVQIQMDDALLHGKLSVK